jgi:hypothetical protein
MLNIIMISLGVMGSGPVLNGLGKTHTNTLHKMRGVGFKAGTIEVVCFASIRQFRISAKPHGCNSAFAPVERHHAA